MNLVDSCGWLEYFADGPNADFFARPIQDTARLVVPAICICEVFRRALQTTNLDDALAIVAAMRLGEVVPLDDTLALQAAQLGVRHKLPLADGIILATARACNATVWTQDAHFANLPRVKYVAKR